MEVVTLLDALLHHCVPLFFGEFMFLLLNVCVDFRQKSKKSSKRRRSKRKPLTKLELFYDILSKHSPESQILKISHPVSAFLFIYYHYYWPSLILWMLGRYFKFFLRPIDENYLINDNHSLGICLAHSYWDGFLSKVLANKGVEAINDDIMKFEDNTGKTLTDDRFFVLIENRCNPPKSKEEFEKDKIESLEIEGAKGIPHPSRPQTMNLNVGKFFNEDRTDYVIVKFDFAQCLKSGMGPKWKMDPRMVQENLKIFLKEMKRHLSGTDYEARKNSVVFITYDSKFKNSFGKPRMNDLIIFFSRI